MNLNDPDKAQDLIQRIGNKRIVGMRRTIGQYEHELQSVELTLDDNSRLTFSVGSDHGQVWLEVDLQDADTYFSV